MVVNWFHSDPSLYSPLAQANAVAAAAAALLAARVCVHVLCCRTPDNTHMLYSARIEVPWRRLDMEAFRAALRSSSLCSADTWSRLDIDGLALLYDTEIITVLDSLVPVATVACRRRPSDPWFDDECAAAKREVRRLERDARRNDPSIDEAATAEWHAARRGYRSLLRRKRDEFWRAKIDAESSTPRQLWKSIDELMGRGSANEPSTIGPRDFH